MRLYFFYVVPSYRNSFYTHVPVRIPTRDLSSTNIKIDLHILHYPWYKTVVPFKNMYKKRYFHHNTNMILSFEDQDRTC